MPSDTKRKGSEIHLSTTQQALPAECHLLVLYSSATKTLVLSLPLTCTACVSIPACGGFSTTPQISTKGSLQARSDAMLVHDEDNVLLTSKDQIHP